MGNRSKTIADMWSKKWKLNTAVEIQMFDRLSDMAGNMLDDTQDMSQWYRHVDMMRMAYARGYSDCTKKWKKIEEMGETDL